MCQTCGCGGAGDVPGTYRLLRPEQDLLAHNDQLAAQNRAWLAANRLVGINLLSSPGAGKTSLLVASLPSLGERVAGVIEGDQQTELDAARIRASGVSAVQIQTGAACHLDAQQVARGLAQLAPSPSAAARLLLIENVGNLICPADFDLGEACRVVVLSVTEGADKPLKYPQVFRRADLLVISKLDLLPAVDFDVAACVAAARQNNPGLPVICLSAKQGQGMDTWYAWLEQRLCV